MCASNCPSAWGAMCVCKLLVKGSIKRYLFHIIKQGRAAPLAYCTQRSYCHWWEGEADHLHVPAKISVWTVEQAVQFPGSTHFRLELPGWLSLKCPFLDPKAATWYFMNSQRRLQVHPSLLPNHLTCSVLMGTQPHLVVPSLRFNVDQSDGQAFCRD